MNEEEMEDVEELFDNDNPIDTQIAVFKIKKDTAEEIGAKDLERAYSDALRTLKHLKEVMPVEHPYSFEEVYDDVYDDWWDSFEERKEKAFDETNKLYGKVGSGKTQKIYPMAISLGELVKIERAVQFVEHIQNHLDKDQEVKCKICDKTIDEIWEEEDECR